MKAEAAAQAGDRWRLWPLVGMWLLIAAFLIALDAPRVWTLSLPDTDDNLRLLQVQDWLAGQGWFDLRQYRLDPPQGADIHWSRLVDLPLAAVILLFTPFVGAHVAAGIAAVGVPLATLFLAILAMSAIGRRLIPDEGWLFAPAVLLTAGPAVAMMAPLRIDHHGWQIAALLGGLAGLVARDPRRGGMLAGFAVAGSLAIGVEMLPYLAALAGFAVLAWIADPAQAPRLRAFVATVATATTAAWLLFVPPAARFAPTCDALSIAYLPSLLAAAAILLAGLRRPPATRAGRAAIAGGAALAAALPLLGPAGTCLADPYHAVYPPARALWLAGVSEALPLWSQSLDVALASLALPVVGLGGAIVQALRGRAEDRLAWALVAGLAALSILLSFLSTRAGVAAQAVAVPGAAALVCAGRRWLATRERMALRVFGTVALFLAGTGLAPRLVIDAAVARDEGPAEQAREVRAGDCLAPAAIRPLDALPAATILAFVDQTPALIANSHHAALAGPYHRNGRAIADAMRAWGGDEAAAHAIVRAHRITYLAFCGQPVEALVYPRRNRDGLYARLAAGRPPAWARPVPVARTGWRVWRVTG